jgi:protein-tyrosine phosphatase
MSTRWIDLEGAHNVRDLGGLAAAGGRTRDGVLLRSDALDQLTAADVQRLVGDVGLAHVVDLRSATERRERGRGPLGATPVRYTEVEVIGPDDLARRAEARAAAFAAGQPAAQVIADGYVELLELGAPAFAAAFSSPKCVRSPPKPARSTSQQPLATDPQGLTAS